MKSEEMLNPKLWAERTFGDSDLKDVRRPRRAVQVAEQMASNASASLPAQMRGWKETIALYRLLDAEEVTFEALMQLGESHAPSYRYLDAEEVTFEKRDFFCIQIT